MLSVENIQEKLAENVFQHTHSPRKASGRAMGTIVEIITYYLLLAWNMRRSISIEFALPEYGRPIIKHNVEYSLHPVIKTCKVEVSKAARSITSNILRVALMQKYGIGIENAGNTLLTKSRLLRNACLIGHDEFDHRLVANLIDECVVEISAQLQRPYMMLECKRVGQDAKNNRGPQAIEKAKQGSYVARSVSALQKIRNNRGEQIGILYDQDNRPVIKPYGELIRDLINADDVSKLNNFLMTVGIISNHGNWFTAGSQNKEMMVLSESYDWALFLTDEGLTEFIETTILNDDEYPAISDAFNSTYSKDNTSGTQFTKTKMNYEAHLELTDYFKKNLGRAESWLSVIQPKGAAISLLKNQMMKLSGKNWGESS